MAQISKQQDSNADVPFFESAEFSKSADNVFHGFFGRQGGVSDGLYGSLNCGRGSDDDPAHVQANLDRVARQACVTPNNLLTMYQVHGHGCLYVDEPWSFDNRPQVDALVTDKAGIALGVLTADCGPVLFYGEKADGAPVIGAAHAGWKGAIGGALDATVSKMQELGADNIKACIGPCIAQSSYEVSAEFFEPFEKENSENERFFMASKKDGHLMFDLAGYCAARLAGLGLKHVFIKDLDTYFNEEDFFSYRRTTHRKESDYGRQISVIAIKN